MLGEIKSEHPLADYFLSRRQKLIGSLKIQEGMVIDLKKFTLLVPFFRKLLENILHEINRVKQERIYR